MKSNINWDVLIAWVLMLSVSIYLELSVVRWIIGFWR